MPGCRSRKTNVRAEVWHIRRISELNYRFLEYLVAART